MRLVIIANPVSGRGRAYRLIREYIRCWPHPDWDVELLTTSGGGHAGALSETLLHDPPDLLGVCGGDGTLNEVACRIPNPPFPVAILPAGTANVVARELRLPLNPVRALQIALERQIRRVDLGDIAAGSRRFVFVAGIGFDAYVAATVRPALKKRLGMAAYAAAVAACLKTYPFPQFGVVADDREYRAVSCLACNARSYGGGLLFCPDADMSDGLLDILVLENAGRLRLAWFLLRAWLGAAAEAGWIHRLRTPRLQIEGPRDVLIQADGELSGRLPVEIGLIEKSFPLVIKSRL